MDSFEASSQDLLPDYTADIFNKLVTQPGSAFEGRSSQLAQLILHGDRSVPVMIDAKYDYLLTPGQSLDRPVVARMGSANVVSLLKLEQSLSNNTRSKASAQSDRRLVLFLNDGRFIENAILEKVIEHNGDEHHKALFLVESVGEQPEKLPHMIEIDDIYCLSYAPRA